MLKIEQGDSNWSRGCPDWPQSQRSSYSTRRAVAQALRDRGGTWRNVADWTEVPCPLALVAFGQGLIWTLTSTTSRRRRSSVGSTKPGELYTHERSDLLAQREEISRGVD